MGKPELRKEKETDPLYITSFNMPKSIIARIDAFLVGHKEYRNRSHLLQMAIVKLLDEQEKKAGGK